MRKYFRFFLFFFLFLFLLLLNPSKANASLVVIDEKGKVTLNVLSYEDSIELEIPRKDYLAIKDIAESSHEEDTKVALTKSDGEIKLFVSTGSSEKSLDVTNYEEEVIELEERPQAERITISIVNEKFVIKQRGVIAETDYEINIDPKSAGLTLATPSGLRFLSILPRQAVDSILRAKIMNQIESGKSLLLKEEAGGELAYIIEGERVINLFNVLDYEVPVNTKVSASTGEILNIDQPTWLKVLGFLFV